MRAFWPSVAGVILAAFLAVPTLAGPDDDERMAWWREARFGMFIHWGLYAIPAGEWGTRTDHGEWIMTTAKIPVEEYEKFADRFNPPKFDAPAIVRAAKNAGMKYIVITTKHHDGFALFDSAVSDYDVMATPFKRDIMKEIAEAAAAEGLRICWYHSIMDWHHPDYLPRRDWEKRPADGADFDRYVAYMKAQLTELLTKYGPIGVLWFDGQWEGTWNDAYGADLLKHVRSLQPSIIVNNRVGQSGGSYGLDRDVQEVLGDYGTPEQHIPATGIPGVDWETCMTMNRNWGYNKADKDYKSTRELIQKLADIASKGGNFLLNVGPTADGEIPPESMERLEAIGNWMRTNAESIHGTMAGPFPSLPWGRCTSKPLGGGITRLYLHVFDWPASGELVVPGILNDPSNAFLLLNRNRPLSVRRHEDRLIIDVPTEALDSRNTVVALDIHGKPDIVVPPELRADTDIFVDQLEIEALTGRENVELRCTADGSDPTASSPLMHGPIRIADTTTLSVRAFRGDAPVSPVARATYSKVKPRPAAAVAAPAPGLRYEYFEKTIGSVSELESMQPLRTGSAAGFDILPRTREENFCFRFTGYVRIPRDGVYRFSTRSDDGSRLWIGDQLVADNDRPHGVQERSGVIALAAGLHPVTVAFFQNSGGLELKVLWSGPDIPSQEIPPDALYCE